MGDEETKQSEEFPDTPPGHENLALELLLLDRESIQGHDLLGRIAEPAHHGRSGYPRIYGKGRISGSADELSETVVMGTPASGSGTRR